MGQLQVGVATRLITPPVGLPLAGYLGDGRGAVGIHDDLTCRALVLSDGHRKAALMTLDLIAVSKELVSAARHSLSRKARLLPQNVLVGATHTHSGPATVFLRLWGRLEPGYVSALPGTIGDVVAQANGSLEDARVGFATGALEGLTANAMEPEGPLDATVGVMRVEAASGKPLAYLVTYPCHPSLLGPENALYSGAVARAIEAETGAVELFLVGPCGDQALARAALFRGGGAAGGAGGLARPWTRPMMPCSRAKAGSGRARSCSRSPWTPRRSPGAGRTRASTPQMRRGSTTSCSTGSERRGARWRARPDAR